MIHSLRLEKCGNNSHFFKCIKSNPANYRPISITSAVGKILESISRDIIVAYMNDYNLYSDCQHGFRKHRRCVTQFLHVVEDLSDMFDNDDPFDIIYLDSKKAFDQVSHKRLAVKLESYGIASKLHKWISCFLSNRLQWMKVGTSCSNKSNVITGIPQGSILGPTLFAIYINDLPNCLTSQCKMFADDLKINNK